MLVFSFRIPLGDSSPQASFVYVSRYSVFSKTPLPLSETQNTELHSSCNYHCKMDAMPFSQRVGKACYASAVYATAVSVCPSVRPSVTFRCFVVRMKLRSCGFHQDNNPSFWRGKDRLGIRRGSSLARELKCGRRLSQAKI